MSKSTFKHVPEGFIEGPHGTLHPIENVKPADLKRDKLVRDLIEEARGVAGVLVEYRQQAMQKIEAFIKRAEKEYKVKHGGEKGNVSLMTYDGREKITISIGNQYVINERFGVAQSLIYECIEEWTEGANKHLVAIIQDAFKKDSNGNAIPDRILGLKRIKINHPTWRKAMKALEESIQITPSKPYLRCHVKNDHEEWVQVPLDIAKTNLGAA